MRTAIVDTNVLRVANGDTPQADVECLEACVERLMAVQAGELLLHDEGLLILNEYRENAAFAGRPGGVRFR